MMEFKKCEHCGEQIHIRSQKCPFCNQTVEETPLVEEVPNSEEVEKEVTDINDEKIQVDSNEEEISKTEEPLPEIPQANAFDFKVGEEPQDYVYKAEVKHSLEYTRSVSNLTKVFLSALCTIPLIGQILGTFLGVFFITYEDSDRKSFGKALIILSVIMFLLYAVYIKQVTELINSADFNAIYDSLTK